MKTSELFKKLKAKLFSLQQSCEEALSGEWDRTDDGFQAMISEADASIVLLGEIEKGVKIPRISKKRVIISVRGGVVDLVGLPAGIVLEVRDYDIDGEESPQTDPDGDECRIAVYE